MGSLEAVVLILAVTVVLLTPALIFGDGITPGDSVRTMLAQEEPAGWRTGGLRGLRGAEEAIHPHGPSGDLAPSAARPQAAPPVRLTDQG